MAMSIDEVLYKKTELEHYLSDLVVTELCRFLNETGFSIGAVNVKLFKTNNNGNRPVYVPGGVTCTIALE